jgi:2-C-methyl-D-erythritol 4-phosphate cytidylyltransferase / 2-C-methyl-D-erythritol 2,4-cyclodiphosphate synthase
MSEGVWAVVVAAGRGERLGLGYNKALHVLSGRSVIARTMDALEMSRCFEGAILVLGEKDEQRYRALTAVEGESPLIRAIAFGGSSRRESVWNGLAMLPEGARIVAIHDAARCFVPPELVRRTVESASDFGSGVAASPVTDTIKRIDETGCAVATVSRSALRAVQTPQTFQVDLIRRAHESARQKGLEDFTDDAALVECAFGPVHLVESRAGSNPKLTTPEDVRAAQAMLASELRVGQGYDAHRLVEGRALVLCGVEIPYEKGLLGHSDADVAAHALMDALLGAAALQDIGHHFPDSDPAYRGADSMALTARVAAILKEHGWYSHNVDVTIVAQAPKLMPYREQMRENVAHALGIPVERVSVKATTTEHMGYEGRGEGMSATAVATITK